MSIKVQIFLGIMQTSEVRMYLNQNADWQTASVEKKTLLKEATWNQKIYLGYYLASDLNYLIIKKNEEKIKSELQVYCPKLNLDQHLIFLFPQTLIH
jgi:hypothetical protein